MEAYGLDYITTRTGHSPRLDINHIRLEVESTDTLYLAWRFCGE